MNFGPGLVPIPKEPGTYFWTEWNQNVALYKKPRCRSLFVTPPGGVEVRITPRIAGDFIAVSQTG